MRASQGGAQGGGGAVYERNWMQMALGETNRLVVEKKREKEREGIGVGALRAMTTTQASLVPSRTQPRGRPRVQAREAP
jgi:hypothetical protein